MKTLLDIIKIRKFKNIIIFVDNFFKKKIFKNSNLTRKIIYIDTTYEPTTNLIDKLISKLSKKNRLCNWFWGWKYIRYFKGCINFTKE